MSNPVDRTIEAWRDQLHLELAGAEEVRAFLAEAEVKRLRETVTSSTQRRIQLFTQMMSLFIELDIVRRRRRRQVEYWRSRARQAEAEVRRLRHAIEAHHVCSVGWRKSSAVDRELWNSAPTPSRIMRGLVP